MRGWMSRRNAFLESIRKDYFGLMNTVGDLTPTRDKVLSPLWRSSQSLSTFGAPGRFTAIPTIAIGSNTGGTSLEVEISRRLTSRPAAEICRSKAPAKLFPGPTLRSSMGRRRLFNLSTVDEVTLSQSAIWVRIISTTSSTSGVLAVAGAPVNVEMIGALRASLVGNLIPRLRISRSTWSLVPLCTDST